MKLSRRMKLVGMIVAAVLILLVAFIAFMVIVGSDVLSDRATDTQLLSPDGAATGRALIVYNPGLSGAPKDAAISIAGDLRAKGYEVTLAGVKSVAAGNVSSYNVIIVGGPIYAGKVSSSVDSYLRALTPPEGAKVGAYAIGGSNVQAFPSEDWLKSTALFPSGSSIEPQRAAFEADLLK